MIYLIIGVTGLGLFLNLINKEDLFKDPVTAKKIIIISTIVVLSSIAGYIQIKSDIDQENSRIIVEGLDNKADSLLKANDSLTIKSNLLQATIDTLRIENDRAHKSHEDSLKTFHYNTVNMLGRYGLKVDTLTNRIEKYDHSARAALPPTLAILETPFSKPSNGEFILTYYLRSLNDVSHLIEGSYSFVNIDLENNTLELLPTTGLSRTNITDIIPNGDDLAMEQSISIDKFRKQISLGSTFYLAILWMYQSKSGKIQQPLKKVYRINADNSIHSLDNFELYKITSFLESKGAW